MMFKAQKNILLYFNCGLSINLEDSYLCQFNLLTTLLWEYLVLNQLMVHVDFNINGTIKL
jgi:hypothetical protein